MGRRLKHQRKGKGSQVFQATKRALADTSYPQLSLEKRIAQVLELETDCGRSGVLAKLLYEGGKSHYIIAAEGQYVGQTIEEGKGS
ncbi:MAG: 50S ribosomal protein L2, partial [archaeon]